MRWREREVNIEVKTGRRWSKMLNEEEESYYKAPVRDDSRQYGPRPAGLTDALCAVLEKNTQETQKRGTFLFSFFSHSLSLF